jgi:hypothetical protein
MASRAVRQKTPNRDAYAVMVGTSFVDLEAGVSRTPMRGKAPNGSGRV